MTGPRRPDTDRLELSLERGSEPISGEVSDGDGLRRRFAGWLQLMSILERARGEEGRVPPPTSPD